MVDGGGFCPNCGAARAGGKFCHQCGAALGQAGVGTDFATRCEILGEMYALHRGTEDETWAEFFAWADVGLPLAYCASQDLVEVKDEARTYVDQTWDTFCEMIDIDPNGSYASLDDAFSRSPNQPLE